MNLADIDHNFKHHPPTPEKVLQHTELRSAFHALAVLLCNTCLDTPERTLSIRKLEEALFWANATVARYSRKDD